MIEKKPVLGSLNSVNLSCLAIKPLYLHAKLEIIATAKKLVQTRKFLNTRNSRFLQTKGNTFTIF